MFDITLCDKVCQCLGTVSGFLWILRFPPPIKLTEAIWLGSRRSCHEQLLPDKHLSWSFSGKFKLLGISFNLSESDKTLENFTEKVQSVKKILNLWCYRDLTYIGKVWCYRDLTYIGKVWCYRDLTYIGKVWCYRDLTYIGKV